MNKKIMQKLTAITTAAVLAASIAPMSASAAWNKDANANWSWTENGQKSTGWKWIHGNWYYFDGSGIMQTGWKFINSQWYYMDQSGAMKTGWQFINGEWYHLAANGAMTKGWYKEGSHWYHLNENGVMSRHWRKISNKWYHFNPSGQMSIGWINWHNNHYFSSKDGVMQTGLVQIDNKVYYFDEVTGELQTGRIKVGNITYTFGEDGAATGALLPKADIAFDSNGNEKTPGDVISGGDTSKPSRPSGGGGGGGSSYVEVQSISLNKTSHIMTVGDDFLLTAAVYPSNATNKKVTWISTDKNIATVTNGYVRALKEGKVTIKAIADTVEATCEIEVMAKGGQEEIKVTSITVSSTNGKNEAHVGDTLQLQAAVKPDDATNKDVTWSSSNKEFATVDANGLVKGVKEGKATITATAKDGSGVTGTFDVEITAKPASESATPTFTKDLDDTKDVKKGDSVTLSVTASAPDGGTLTYQWYKGDKAIGGATDASYTFTADTVGSESYKVVVTNTKDNLTPATATSKTCVVTVTEEVVESKNLIAGLRPEIGIGADYIANIHHEDSNDMSSPLKDEIYDYLTDGIYPAVDAVYDQADSETSKSTLYFNYYDVKGGAADFTFQFEEKTFEQITLMFRNGTPWGTEAVDGVAEHIKVQAEIDGVWTDVYEGRDLNKKGHTDIVLKTEDGKAITATGLKFWFYTWTDETIHKTTALAEIEVLDKATGAAADGILAGSEAPDFVAVTDITGVPTTATAGEDLTLTGTVAPDNATNKTIAWSVTDAGETGATIEGNVLKTTAAGTVKVTATIANGVADGEDFVKEFTITVNEAITSDNLLFGTPWTSTTVQLWAWNGSMDPNVLTDDVIGQDTDPYEGMISFSDEVASFVYDKPMSFKELQIHAAIPGNLNPTTPAGIKIEVNQDGSWMTIADKQDFAPSDTGRSYVFATADGNAIDADQVRITFTKVNAQGKWGGISLTEIEAFAETTGAVADAELSIPTEATEVPTFNVDLESAKTVGVGESLTLSVEASVSDGGTLSYQWYKNDELIPGATSPEYSLVGRTKTVDNYKVVVTNAKSGMIYSNATSTVCAVTVESALDNIAKGASYTLNPSGDSLTFSGDAIDDGIKLTDDVTPSSSEYDNPGFVTVHIPDSSTSTLEITLDLGAEKAFEKVAIDTLKGTAGVNPIENGKVSYSTNGQDWVDFGTIAHTQENLGVETIWVNAEAPVKAQYVKVSIDGANSWRSLAEIRVWGESIAPEYVAVTDITGIPTEMTAGEDLTLTGTVTPETATNKAITWSVKDAGTTGATIEGNVLKATAAGTVQVTATVANGATANTDFVKDFTITVNPAPVVSSNLLAGKTWTSTTVVSEGYGDAPFVAKANTWLTDGERPTPETISTATKEDCGVVLFYTNAERSVQSFEYALDPGKDTFKQIQISVLNQMKGDTKLGATPKTIKIEANIDGEWKTIFENAEAYTDLGANKNFVFSSDKAITASQLRFSFTSQTPSGWPGVALNEIEVLADAATGGVDGELTAPEAPDFVAVTDITGVPTEGTTGKDLTLTGTVAPDTATNKTIVWSVKDAGTTGATIEGNILKTTAAGTVTVTATVANGASESSDFTKDFEIVVSDPAPVSDNLIAGKAWASANIAPHYAHDGNPNLSSWMTDGKYIEASANGQLEGRASFGAQEGWVVYDFGSKQNFREIKLNLHKFVDENGEANGVIPGGVRFEISDDNINWKTVYNNTEFPDEASDGIYDYIFRADDDLSAQYVRMTLTKRPGGVTIIYVDELEVLQTPTQGAADGTLAVVADEEVPYDGTPTIYSVNSIYVKDGANPDWAALVSYDSDNKKFVVSAGKNITEFVFTDADGNPQKFIKSDGSWTMSAIDNLIFGIPYTYDEGKYHDSALDDYKTKLTDGSKEVTAWNANNSVGFWPESGVAHVSFDFGKVVEFKEIRLGNYAGEAGIENLKNIKIEIQKEDGSWVTILNENGMVTEPVGYREFIFNSDTAFRAKGMKLTLAAGTGYQFYNELQVLAEKGSDVADAGLAEVVGGDVNLAANKSYEASYNPAENYATSWQTKLTDEMVASQTNYSDPAYAAWSTYASSEPPQYLDITVDLGASKNIKEANIHVMSMNDYGIMMPKLIEVYTSNDKTDDGSWVKLGEITAPSDEVGNFVKKVTGNANAQYVKYHIVCDGMIFISELQVLEA